MLLFIDKIVAKVPKGLCLLIGIICVVLSAILLPHNKDELYIEGVISEYIEEITHRGWGKGGGTSHYEMYYIVIDGIKISVSAYDKKNSKGEKSIGKRN